MPKGSFNETRPLSESFKKKMTELREQFKKGPPPLTEADKIETPLKRGIALFKQQKWLEARQQFEQAVRQAPKDANTYYHRGLAAKRMNDLGLALRDFSRALELDPEDADAYFHRGEIYERQTQDDKALADYQQALQLNPDYTEARQGQMVIHIKRGLDLFTKKQFDLAVGYFNRAITVKPNVVGPYLYRAWAYEGLGYRDLALADYQHVIELDPKSVDSYYARAIFYIKQKMLDKAITDLKKALQINPEATLVHEALKKAQQELKMQTQIKEMETRYSKYVRKIAVGYKKEKGKLKTQYEAEIKRLKEKIKVLEKDRKMLLEIAKQRPEYHYHITAPELSKSLLEPEASMRSEMFRKARLNLPDVKDE